MNRRSPKVRLSKLGDVGEVETPSRRRKAAKPIIESREHLVAWAQIDPVLRHASLATVLTGRTTRQDAPKLHDSTVVVSQNVSSVMRGELDFATRILVSQTVTLDAIFTELVRHAVAMMGEHPQAMERFLRLAMKSQSNCRASLEALAKLHTPREQVIKHIHVGEGGQALVTEQFHHHGGDGK